MLLAKEYSPVWAYFNSINLFETEFFNGLFVLFYIWLAVWKDGWLDWSLSGP